MGRDLSDIQYHIDKRVSFFFNSISPGFSNIFYFKVSMKNVIHKLYYIGPIQDGNFFID